jgi:hypothetical protein
MRGLGVVAFINFSQWVLGKFSFGLGFFFRGRTMKFGPAYDLEKAN